MPRPSQTGLSHIEAAHAIPELKPRMVADAVGTSLRTLQGVFAEREDAIARRVQNARMAAPARWLADPAMRKQKIGEIASCRISPMRLFAPTRKPQAAGADVSLRNSKRPRQLGYAGR